jgi:hypothetical protein
MSRPLPPGIVSADSVVVAARTVKRKNGKPPHADNGKLPQGAALHIETLPDGTKRLHYDVSGFPDVDDLDALPTLPEGLAPDEPPWPLPREEDFPPGSFGERMKAKRRDLVGMLVNGVPPVEYLPASEGMLVRGKRHQIPAPKKTGKSLGMLVHWCDMIAAGARGIVVLDRENGADEYARRLHGIFRYKGYSAEEVANVRARLHYFEFPRFKRGDGEDFREFVESLDAELVVFDSQRMFLTDLGLAEDSTDDYSVFMATVVDPLFRAGITTLILDNTGHSNKDRARGASGKGDLNEVLMLLETELPFDLNKQGRLKLKILESRFGNRGEWLMDIGGGTFGSWHEPSGVDDNAELRRAAIEIIGSEPGIGANRIIQSARERGVKVGKQEHARTLLNRYADDERCPIRRREGRSGGYELG